MRPPSFPSESLKTWPIDWQRGSATTVIVLILMIFVIIVGSFFIKSDNEGNAPVTPSDGSLDARVLIVSQTALDRTINELVVDPSWRDGFHDVPCDGGRYSVDIIDGTSTVVPPLAPGMHRNYVKIVATAEVGEVRRVVEAVWANALAAFEHTYAAGNEIELANHGTRRIEILGSIHNNAWNGGRVIVHRGTTIYGDVASAGTIDLGTEVGMGYALVYGSLCGRNLELGPDVSIRRFENLDESREGLDLNGDGDANDYGLTRRGTEVAASNGITVAGRRLSNGDRDRRIDNGGESVRIGSRGVGPIVDPRPDFSLYYELATGQTGYPPSRDHVSSPILGDGDGHYFSSAGVFLDWLGHRTEVSARCWRCAGSGYIGRESSTTCLACAGTGSDTAVEIAGVFYIDDATLDLSNLGRNLIVHGTIVVAAGDPGAWPARIIGVPGGRATIAHSPTQGSFVIKGPNRPHLTQTYRSDEDGGSYRWVNRPLFNGEDTQTIPLPLPSNERAMHDFPAVLAAGSIEMEPRRAGFAYHPGDIGDEKLTILQGVMFAEERVEIHGHGGWSGETIVFDEGAGRSEDEELDEAVLNVDLNGDGDLYDRVEVQGISTVPVIPLSEGNYGVDLNNDGLFAQIEVGADYIGFFDANDYRYPVLIYLEGTVLSQSIHSCEQVLVVRDPRILESGIPFGFDVNFGDSTYQGLVSLTEAESP